MIDTHCHLDDARYDADRAEVVARAKAAGITRLVVPGVGPEKWDALVDASRADPFIQACAGIHPQLLPELDASRDGENLEKLDARLVAGGCIAVGECGIDGPSVALGASMERQIAVFRAHLTLARKHGLPVIAHCLRAHPELRQVLEEDGVPEAGLEIHSYSGGPELVKIFGPMGCYFGVAGPVSYAGARKPIATAAAIPSDRFLLETDAPDQSPTPLRGQRNEPANLIHVATALANVRGVPLAELVAQASANARRLFRKLPSD
ncbi:MAG: TatD family hydrolase [Deltaproteobacteria bacterium]|nr:TatD family hydrolase [Deltaproteobacteria bacterium]